MCRPHKVHYRLRCCGHISAAPCDLPAAEYTDDASLVVSISAPGAGGRRRSAGVRSRSPPNWICCWPVIVRGRISRPADRCDWIEPDVRWLVRFPAPTAARATPTVTQYPCDAVVSGGDIGEVLASTTSLAVSVVPTC